MAGEPERRERTARLLGVAAALLAMTLATWAFRWPAPAIAVAIGLIVYGLARRR